jgi:hypothetical protein
LTFVHAFVKVSAKNISSFAPHAILNLWSRLMRKLIVCNFATLDGYYEDKNHEIGSLFKYYYEGYEGDNHF